MDWSKAKNTLIVALICANLFLLWAVFFSHDEVTSDPQVIDQTAEILAENGISLFCEIPTEYERAAVLSVLYDDTIGSFEYEPNPEETIKELTEENAQKAARDFLLGQGLMTKTTDFFSISLSPGVEKTYRVKYKNIMDGIEIEDCYTICTVTKDGVIKMDRYWLTPSGYGKNKGNITPATIALLSFMTNNPENKKRTITDISLVYKVDLPYSEITEAFADTAFPTWRISCSDGTKTYYQALEL